MILTTSTSKTKDVITGDNTGWIAIVKVTGGDEDPDKGKKDKAYDGKLGDRGFGTVLTVIRR